MKILVTGAKGFVGRNLVQYLLSIGYEDILEYDVGATEGALAQYAKECGFVFHLAGVNRPMDDSEFMAGNFGFTSQLLEELKKNNNMAPVAVTSSIQAVLDNPYGNSKKAGEDLMFEYSRRMGAPVYVFRLANVFGKWSRPNYNSAVATFCHNIARGLPIVVNDRNADINLLYIDDLVKTLARLLRGDAEYDGGFCTAGPVYTVKLGRIADLLYSFPECRRNLEVPDMSDAFVSKLYSTYLSFLPADKLAYPLNVKGDERGSFAEFIRTPDRGQVSVNISRPGQTKGNHWHHSKNEKFLTVAGEGVVRFRKVGGEEIVEYRVSGSKLEVLDIPPGCTHNIENVGGTDLVTIMWANEPYDPQSPDTHYLKV